LKKGIKADISLEEKRLDQPFGVNYYLWLPTKDGRAPSFKQLLIGANFIKQLISNKIKVYVHCEHGHGRSSTLVAAYFILEGKSVDEAIGLIKKNRHGIHLSEYQIKALKIFESKIRKFYATKGRK
jgi:protein-tyrosine phosphatase